MQFTIEPPNGAGIMGASYSVDISTAARRVAFIARDSAGVSRVYVRAFADVQSQRLDGTEGVQQLTFSPDGAWIAFFGNGKLKKIPATGGSALALTDISSQAYGADWAVDGHIYFPDGRSILVIPENGGAAKTLGPLVEVGRSIQSLRVLADGTTVLFTDGGGLAAASRLLAYSLASDSVSPVGIAGTRAFGVRDNLLVYGDASGAIYGVPYDAKRRTVRGEPRLLSNTADRASRVALAADGSLAYFLGDKTNALTLVGPGGAIETLRGGLDGASEPRVSPDGKRIVMFSEAVSEVRTYDLEARSLTRNTFGPANATVYSRPEWTPDGALVLRTQSGAEPAVLTRHAANESRVPDVLHRDAKNSIWEGVVSPDGQYLLYRVGTGNGSDVRCRRMSGDTASRPFAATPASEREARFSPAGQWVAYSSNNAAAALDVYVRAFPDGQTAYRISESGGAQPVWARDGQSLYYVASDGVLLRAKLGIAGGARPGALTALSPTAGASTTAAPRVTARDTVVRGGFELTFANGHAPYDVMPDGRVVLMRRMQNSQRLVVAYGWLAALRAEWAKTAR